MRIAQIIVSSQAKVTRTRFILYLKNQKQWTIYMKKWFLWHWTSGNEGQWFLKYEKQMRWALCLPQIIALRAFPHQVSEMLTQGESGGLSELRRWSYNPERPRWLDDASCIPERRELLWPLCRTCEYNRLCFPECLLCLLLWLNLTDHHIKGHRAQENTGSFILFHWFTCLSRC